MLSSGGRRGRETAGSGRCGLCRGGVSGQLDHGRVTENDADIVVTCFGHDKGAQFVDAVRQFEECVARRTQSFRVIADLRLMTGYESDARRAWQESFREHRRLMRRVVFVGAQSRGIRMGAAVVGAVAGVPVRFVSEWSQTEAP